MAEKLEIYDLNSNLIKVQERTEFYQEARKEFAETGKISRKVKSVRLILMNSQGKIYLQKRSKIKSENAGMYDKTVGGHVSAGDSFDLTAIRECAEELGFPATILSENDFSKAVKNIDLSIIGVFKKIDCLSNFLSTRALKRGGGYEMPFITTIYVGYHDGSIKFVDGECSGVEVFSLAELQAEIKGNPAKFTEDLKFMVEKYSEFLVPVDSL